MSGKVIGKTLPFGYRGNVARTPDCLIQAYCNVGTDPILYGEPVVFDTTYGGVRKITTTDTDNTGIIGIAVRRMGQPHADSAQGWYYAAGEEVDVLVRGTICVELKDATSIAARGALYVANGNNSTTSGDLYAATGSGHAITVPNAYFTVGVVDGNKIAEVSILERKM